MYNYSAIIFIIIIYNKPVARIDEGLTSMEAWGQDSISKLDIL